MAQGGSGNFAAGVIDLLGCAVCLEQYVDPRNLNCLHKYCKKCLGPLLQNSRIRCPQCRELTNVPNGDINLLKRDSTIASLIALTNDNKKGQRNLKECGFCEEVETLLNFCNRCELSLCKNCSRTHPKASACTLDDLVSLEEIFRSKVNLAKLKLIECEQFSNKILSQKQKVKNSIQQHVNDILSIVESKKLQLLDEVDIYFDNKMDIFQNIGLQDKMSSLNTCLIESMKTHNVDAIEVELDETGNCLKRASSLETLKSSIVFDKGTQDIHIGGIRAATDGMYLFVCLFLLVIL